MDGNSMNTGDTPGAPELRAFEPAEPQETHVTTETEGDVEVDVEAVAEEAAAEAPAESELEVETIRSLGCRNIQGYYYGRPMPATDVLTLFGPSNDRSVAAA